MPITERNYFRTLTTYLVFKEKPHVRDVTG